MSKIAQTTDKTWTADDARWCASRMGRTVARSITLNLALFNALHAPSGFLPSGLVLGKVTATGKYGPYSPLLSNGLEVAAGFLFTPQVMESGETGFSSAALYWTGIVNQDFLPEFTGAAAAIGVVDAAARADMAAWIRFEGTDL